ncbi:beta-1,3-galactosyltransferase 1 [Drosophila rhopaloa]|uniref:Hexosyltransferase n=1 Tax=Drosophila rhopaloa TaxID=1041015 RepID=A0A6P4FKM7_DRORH|nr:beta-1,3-galactosyltransferase 1 [Drosophila rhopaloa]
MIQFMRPLRRLRIHLPRTLRLRRYKLILVLIFVLFFFYRDQFMKHMEDNDRQADLPGWEREKPLKISYYLDQKKDTALIEPQGFCKSKTFLIIAVCSSLDHFAQRQIIRETWGNTKEFNYEAFEKLHYHLKGKYLPIMPSRVRLYAEYLSGFGKSLTAKVQILFIVGRARTESQRECEKLSLEANQYNDILQENFADSYNNLTLKTVMALKYISQRCSSTSAFILKCDDDSFINVPNLLHFLLGGTIPLYTDTVDYHFQNTYKVMSPWNRFNASGVVMYGHKFCNMEVDVDVKSPWYVPQYMFEGFKYPVYLSGTGYLLSIDVVQRLYEEALTTSLVHLEDVFVTGICAEKAGIQRHHHPLFNYVHGKPLCIFKGTISLHPMPGNTMSEAWAFVSNYNIKCPPPDKHFIKKQVTKKAHC